MARSRLLSSVVVPTDFSAGAQVALERALHLPLAKKAKVTLIHVLPEDIPGKLRKQAIEEAERSLEKAIARVHGLAAARGLSPAQFVTDVLEGEPAQQILKRAHTVEAEVVVLGRHGRRPVVDLFMGSTAQKVVRRGDVPVLLTQLPAPHAYHRALVAVDLKRSSLELVKQARPVLAQAVEVTVFHASRVPFEEYVTMTGELTRSYREDFLADAKADLDTLLKKTQLDATPVAQPGDARLLVLEEVRERRIELLVVGTHRKKRLERLFMGSVAEWLLTHATCDVLVAHV
ncbi:MAG: universal stress protein [Myxococcota bacterium]|jgi:nucleotide-binding universal stress UspA family protein